MRREFHRDTVNMVLGIQGEARGYTRIPLYVEYGPGPDFVPAVQQPDTEDEAAFNTIGSAVVALPGLNIKRDIHLPVIDLDGGASVQEVNTGSKVVLRTAPHLQEHRRKFGGKYGPQSLLRDVLGDNGINLEVFQAPVLGHSHFAGRAYHHGNIVTSLALRTKDWGMFDVVDSTQKGHNHLYIQKEFEGEDHRTLVTELGAIGIIGEDWQRLTEQEGMGIVRTPWTKREGIHKRSS